MGERESDVAVLRARTQRSCRCFLKKGWRTDENRTGEEPGQEKNPDRQRIREGKCHVGDFSENTAVFHTGMAERGNEEILWGFADRKNVRFFGDGKTEISVFENFDLKIQKRVDKYENLIYNNIRTKYQ